MALFKLKIKKMKKTLFIGLILGMLTISCSNENELLTLPVVNQVATKTDASTARGSDCKTQFEKKCYFGNPLVLLPGQVTDMIDAQNFCTFNPISCSNLECVARISVLAGIVAGSPKVDSCLPNGYRGK
jgi:hypothetical protein